MGISPGHLVRAYFLWGPFARSKQARRSEFPSKFALLFKQQRIPARSSPLSGSSFKLLSVFKKCPEQPFGPFSYLTTRRVTTGDLGVCGRSQPPGAGLPRRRSRRTRAPHWSAARAEVGFSSAAPKFSASRGRKTWGTHQSPLQTSARGDLWRDLGARSCFGTRSLLLRSIYLVLEKYPVRKPTIQIPPRLALQWPASPSAPRFPLVQGPRRAAEVTLSSEPRIQVRSDKI